MTDRIKALIEAGALAICASKCGIDTGPETGFVRAQAIKEHAPESRAALLAFLDNLIKDGPTEGMKEAARVDEVGTVDDPYSLIPGTVFRAMLTALKAEIEEQ